MLAGAVAGYMAFPHWSGVLVGIVGGMVPDIDEPNSKISRIGLLRIIAYPLSFLFKHRSFTHSLPFLAASFISSFLLFLISLTATSHWVNIDLTTIGTASLLLSLAYTTGMASHLIGDMLTGKIKLMYPSEKGYGISIPRWSFRLVDIIIRVILLGLIILAMVNGKISLTHLLTFR